MSKWLLILITGLIIISLENCDFEDRYVNVCEGHYGSEKVIDSLVRRYSFNNSVYFAQIYKDYTAPKNSNCDTIELVIQSDTLPIFYNDTFAVSVAKVFFNDSLNKEVNNLKIEVNEFWPAIGKAKINFVVGREHLAKNFLPILLPDTEKMEYEIIEESSYTQYSTGETYKGMHVVVNVKEDYKDFKTIASTIKKRYDSTIKTTMLSQFTIDLIIKSPTCKLCANKSYHFFYDKRNNNM